MADDFVNIPFVLDGNSLADGAIEMLRATWTDWEPNDGDPEVVLIETVSPMAAAVAAIAANMPSGAMIALGGLLGVPYENGMPAEAHVTLTAIDNAGYTVSAPYDQLQIDGYAFELAADAVIPAGESTLSGVVAYATEVGADASGLPGDLVASLNMPPFIANVSLDAPTFGGVDDEDLVGYRNRIARDRRLTARTLITLGDAVIVALDTPGIARAVAIRDTTRHVSVTVVGPDGGLASDPAKTALLATYTDMLGDRLVNTVYDVTDPDYTTVDVTWDATAAPGVDKIDLEARVNAALTQLLSPFGWGTPAPTSRSSTVWVNETTVSVNDVITAIGGVSGLQTVNTVVLSSPTGGAVVQTDGDLLMAGTVALPEPGTMAGTVH